MSAMRVATFNGCKVYNLSSGKTMPEWLSESKKRMLAKDDDYRRRLELIQDFEMTIASQNVKMTRDGEHIIVTGTYPPLIRCYTVSDLSLKFQRGLTCEVVAFETLSDDFGKLVFLQSDRTLNFHAPYGTHYSIRVPKFGRDLAYSWDTCDLYVASSGEEVYRLNLETGQFREPIMLGFVGCNKLHLNPVHQLLVCGGEAAACEFWDPRSKKTVAKLSIDSDKAVEISSVKFDSDGLTLAVGTSNGNCKLYDIRSSRSLFTKEHQYGLPIIDVSFHNASRHIISTDRKIMKIWERDEANIGKILTNIETPADINAVHVVSDRRGESGLIMMAGEQSRVMTYFVPQLGPAPRWCSFLESLTEELEESGSQSVYEDYKFVTRVEVEELGASALIGTPMLKGYMHGFFIEMKLYNKLRAVSKPFEYEEYRLQRIREKIEEKRKSRITAIKRLPKVNKALAEKMMRQENSKKGGAGAGGSTDAAAIVDDRFAALFKREEFQQDEMSDEFKLRNPSLGRNSGSRRRNNGNDSDEDELRDMYDAVDVADGADDDGDDYDEYASGGDDDAEDEDEESSDLEPAHADDDDDDDEATGGGRKRARNAGGLKKHGGGKRSKGRADDDEEEGQIFKASQKAKELMAKLQARHNLGQKPPGVGSATGAGREAQSRGGSRDSRGQRATGVSGRNGGGRSSGSSSRGPKMYELSDGMSSDKALFGHAGENKTRRDGERALGAVPLSQRLDSSEGSGSGRNTNKLRVLRTEKEGLIREISFIPKDDPKPGRGKGGRGGSNSILSDRRDDRERAQFFDAGSAAGGANAAAAGGGESRAGRSGGGRGRGRGSGRGGGRGGGFGRGGGGRGRGGRSR